MPEVNGNDPGIRFGTYINLVPCATPDPDNFNIAHAYNARQVIDGLTVGTLGWLTLEQAREDFADTPYAVRYGSHDACPTCFEKNNAED